MFINGVCGFLWSPVPGPGPPVPGPVIQSKGRASPNKPHAPPFALADVAFVDWLLFVSRCTCYTGLTGSLLFLPTTVFVVIPVVSPRGG